MIGFLSPDSQISSNYYENSNRSRKVLAWNIGSDERLNPARFEAQIVRVANNDEKRQEETQEYSLKRRFFDNKIFTSRSESCE